MVNLPPMRASIGELQAAKQVYAGDGGRSKILGIDMADDSENELLILKKYQV